MEKKLTTKFFTYFFAFIFIFSIFELENGTITKAAGTYISYSTDKNALAAGTNFDIYVNINDVTNLYGASIDFKFDPNLLKVLDIEKGAIFGSHDVNSEILVDNRSNGDISFYTMLRGNKSGIAASNNTLFVIKAQAISSGKMILNTISDNSTLYNPGNNVRIKLSDASTATSTIAYSSDAFSLNIGTQEFTRYSGSDRYKTSVAISQGGWTQSDYVVIATGQDYPDALCATPLAGKYDAPILLTTKSVLDPNVEREINRLKPKYAYIVGGTGVVSSNVEEKLKSKGIYVTRLAGANRFETSALVAKELASSTKAFVVTAYNYPDALSIASYAAYLKAPILLTAKSKLDPAISKIVLNGTIKNTYVVGGTTIITDGLMKTLPSPKRIFGSNRYETNLAALNNFSFDYTNTFIATGENFADALSGSALAGRYGAPLVLVSNSLSNTVITRLREKRTAAVTKYMIGGTAAVSDTIVEKIFK